jgi:hypothetical protein
LFSAVSSAFVIDVHSNLKPDPNEQSAALLRAILLTLNHTAIPGGTATVPPIQEDPPSEIITVTGLMYASLLISLLAAFVAMLGKQWLNRYLRNAGGSMIERCGDRQRKCDGLKKWPFHLFVESLPVMLQVALLLLACGLCKNMTSINTSVASVLISLTVLGVLFYLGIIFAGTSSYECPFQTPVSIGLHSLWKKIVPHITPSLLPIVTTSAALYKGLPWALALTKIRSYATSMLLHITTAGTLFYRHWQHFWGETLFLCQVIHALVQSLLISHPHNPPLPTTQHAPEQPTSWLVTLHSLWENIECKILLLALHLPQTTPPPTIPSTYQWLTPTALDTLQKTNTSDVQCVSWILWNITDPEALDAAIQLAATVPWFQDELKTEPPYDLIISTLKGCFDSTGRVHPGARDRAYSSAQAILWIHICAKCASKEFPPKFTLPIIHFNTEFLDHDLRNLLWIYCYQDAPSILYRMFSCITDGLPVFSQWISNALLHLSWANQSVPGVFCYLHTTQIFSKEPLQMNIILNYLLVVSIFLGLPIDEGVLKVQDKSYVISFFSTLRPAHMLLPSAHMKQIVSQFSQAMITAISTPHHNERTLRYVLLNLTRMQNCPSQLSMEVYEWCSAVCENDSSLADKEALLLPSLKLGFRHLDPRSCIQIKPTHMNHQKIADIVFKNGDNEALADLLYAWISYPQQLPPTVLEMCAQHLIGLQKMQPFPPRLRQLIIQSITSIGGHQASELVGVEEFTGFLNNLCVGVWEIKDKEGWGLLLLHIIQSSNGIQHLSHQYWKLLVEFVISWVNPEDWTYSPHTMISLEASKEWDKLECWMALVWIIWPPEKGETTEEDLEHVMLSLAHQQPGAIQKLKQWMEQWRARCCWGKIPESFHQICDRVEQDVLYVPFCGFLIPLCLIPAHVLFQVNSAHQWRDHTTNSFSPSHPAIIHWK